MTTLSDLGVSAAINIVSALVFLLVFAVLRLQPINDRVYFPKWYITRQRQGTKEDGKRSISNIINLDWKGYLHFLDWTKEALKMPEPELIEHAGFDSAVYLRIYLLGSHWSLVVIDILQKKVFLANSLPTTHLEIKVPLKRLLASLERVFHVPLVPDVTFITCEVPLQNDSSTCGWRVLYHVMFFIREFIDNDIHEDLVKIEYENEDLDKFRVDLIIQIVDALYTTSFFASESSDENEEQGSNEEDDIEVMKRQTPKIDKAASIEEGQINEEDLEKGSEGENEEEEMIAENEEEEEMVAELPKGSPSPMKVQSQGGHLYHVFLHTFTTSEDMLLRSSTKYVGAKKSI